MSLDALDEKLFQSINDVGFPAAKVIEGIFAAQEAGLPVKVNTVLKRGMNESEILPLAEFFRGKGVILRFIEYMDAGTANGWRMDDVISSAEAVEIINRVYPIEPVEPNYRGETAERWRYLDGAGRNRLHQLGDERLLPRLLARAPLGRGKPRDVPIRRSRV